ncbi:hypothetical protein RhiJN_15427 [Ceratobasidium sp. AG-Ba]|nr:hypothetical protein RhiJN_15427 [Ceratobasidium sp. AG-Ba]
MATTPSSIRRPRASNPFAPSNPTTPLAKYSERRPDLYSLSATHAFDWDAARGKRPPPYVSAVGNTSSETLRKRVGRAAVEDGPDGEVATPSRAPKKRIVRKKPWKQWLTELPSNTWDWIYDAATLSNLPLPPPETIGRVLGGVLHLIHFVTRYSILRSHKEEEVGWEDMHREIHIIDGFEQQEPQPWFSWTTPMTIILLILSLVNCLYVFTDIRSYHLHLQQNPVNSPHAKMVRVDMSNVARDMDNRPAPSLIWRLARGLGVHLASACIYSPAHALLWMIFSSGTWFVAFILMAVTSGQIYALSRSYDGLLKDRMILNKEVMHEYNEKFVYPRIMPVRKDACVMTHEAEVVSWRD